MRTVFLTALVVVVAAAVACGNNRSQPIVDIPPAPSPASSPTISLLPPPERPADFQDFATVIAGHLTQAGGSPDCLAALFEAWKMASDATTPCFAADLDGDGEDEYVVRVARESGPEDGGLEGWLAGDILVFGDVAGGYDVVFRLGDIAAFSEGDLLQPTVFDVGDFNADGRAEALLTTSMCGAHTCSLTVYLIGHVGGEYVSILVPGNGMDGAVAFPIAEDQLRLEDVDGDGETEILLREGFIGSVGAGPQREAMHTYRWDGERYSPTDVEYGPSELRYFKVRDADDAFAEGDYELALALYREAAESSTLEDFDLVGDPAELRAYARFRVGLVQAVQGDEAAALAALDAAIAADPDALHSQMAAQFRLAYRKVNHVNAGCAAARDFIDGNLDAFAALWEYGYANPGFQPGALCPS